MFSEHPPALSDLPP